MKSVGQFLLLCSCCLPLLLMGTEYGAEAKRPNIIFIFIDDMGWGDFSCFGNADAETPNIDSMAASGIAFEQFYVNAPICSPSRVAVSTGTYPQRWGITSYLADRALNEERSMAHWLEPEAPMLARSLQESGYATGHFGKWHMGGQRDVNEAPPITEYGFDVSLTNFEGKGPKLLPLTLNPNGEVKRIWEDAVHLGGPAVWMQRSSITSGFVESAIAFMESAQRERKPFYVNIWPDDVHSPFWPPVEKWGDGSKRTLYLSVLEEMDRQFGRLFEFISADETLRENCLILICSDNGPERGAGTAGPFRGRKGYLLEGGIRSPLIVWGPGLLNPEREGTRNTTSVFSAMDLVPTLIELSGRHVPEGVDYDGENLLPTLLGKSMVSREAPLYFSRPALQPGMPWGGKRDLAVRSGKWKLLCDLEEGVPSLYNLEMDPSESNDLAMEYRQIAEKLASDTRNWFKSVSRQNN